MLDEQSQMLRDPGSDFCSSTCWIHFLQQQNQSTSIFCHTHGLWRAVLEPCFLKSFSKNKDNTFHFFSTPDPFDYISLLNSITFFSGIQHFGFNYDFSYLISIWGDIWFLAVPTTLLLMADPQWIFIVVRSWDLEKLGLKIVAT